jgi:hypothetical protein
MWQSFTVKNFRSFRELTLQPLGRVNLIAGKNNSGKTALLEALYLHSYPQDVTLPFSVNELRGPASLKKYDHSLCSWLFHDKNTSCELELSGRDEQGATHTLRMWVGESAFAQYPEAKKYLAPSFINEAWSAKVPALLFKGEAAGKETWSVSFPSDIAISDGMSWIGSNVPWNGPSIFIGSVGRPPDEDVKVFREVEAAGRQEEMLPGLQILEPRLQRLSVEFSGSKEVIQGDIGLSHPVPLSFMGEGTRRLLSIVLAITTASGGNVLIDEVESGLHYSVLTRVWQAIGHAARQADVQVFATTHSYECIVAAHEAFTANGPYDLRLFRLDRVGEEIKVAAYDKDVLGYATEMNHEVR